MTGDDLRQAVDDYIAASAREDIAWSIRCLRRLQDVTMEHFLAKLDEADDEGLTWVELGQVFAMDPYDAWVQFGGYHGPERPERDT